MLHPLARERAIALSRSRRAGLVAVAVAGLVALWLIEGHAVARWLVAYPLVLAAALGALAYGLGRAALGRYHAAVATGWWAAAPVAVAARRAGAALVVFGLGLALLLAVLLVTVAAGEHRGAAATTIGLAAVVAIALAAAAATTRHRDVAARRRQVAAPLTAPRLTPRVRALPTLPLWQRKETAARWRAGNGALQVGALALMVPMGTPLGVGIAMLVSAAALVWLAVMLGTSYEVARAARSTLAAVPVRPRDFLRAASAYPASGALAAIALTAAAGMLGGALR